MKIAALGEDAVVAAITRGLPLGGDVRHGAGDDCAVIGGTRDRLWQLLKTDCVVEGVHFEKKEKPNVNPVKTPIIKKTGENIYCAVRMGGMGIAIGSLVGEDAASMVLENNNNHDHNENFL